jgi:hypothetical protein
MWRENKAFLAYKKELLESSFYDNNMT